MSGAPAARIARNLFAAGARQAEEDAFRSDGRVPQILAWRIRDGR
jgi:hypothetical protein